MQIRKSAEDYLEAILVLSKQGGGLVGFIFGPLVGFGKRGLVIR